MAYFRCTTGGSGKGNTLVVTCADDLAGATITCTNGTKTYTKTCPSTSPYEVTFYGLAAGTYTISATVSGNTFTTTVVITDYEAELGGFNWKTWVNLSENYTSSDFTDLDDLLSDETAVRELMIIHACVDYLAGIATASADVETIIGNDLCAKWINLSDYALDTLYANTIIADYMDEADKYFYGEWALVGQVPKMTSNTAPYGEAFGTAAQQTGREAYKAFDGDSSTFAVTYGASASISPTVEKYIGYNFGKPTSLSKVSIYNGLANAYAGDFEIQGSDDGTTWTKIGDTHTFSTTDALINIPITDNVAYSRYRIYTLSGNNKNGSNQYYLNLMELQFYAWQPKGNVPVMTANNAPYGEAIINNAYKSSVGYRAFDGDTTTNSMVTAGANARIGFKFTNPVSVKKVAVQNRSNSTGNPLTYKIIASNDGATWEDLTEVITNSNPTSPNFIDVHEISNDNYYLYYAINPLTANNDTVANIATIQFYGRELSVSVPVITSLTAPFGNLLYSQYLVDTQYNIYCYPYYPFNGSDYSGSGNNRFLSKVADSYLGYEFNGKVKVVMAKYITGTGGEASTYKYIYSDDGGNTWNDASDVKTSTDSTITYIDELDAGEHKAWGVRGVDHSGQTCVGTLQFYGLDYSEKEFETGTTKKWLYDHGVELETLTTEATAGTVTKQSDSILMNCTSGGSTYARVRTDAIDFTPYDLLRVKVGKELVSGGQSRFGIASVASRDSYLADVGNVAIGTQVPNNTGLDISSYNSSYYPNVYNADTGGKLTLVEWWLE